MVLSGGENVPTYLSKQRSPDTPALSAAEFLFAPGGGISWACMRSLCALAELNHIRAAVDKKLYRLDSCSVRLSQLFSRCKRALPQSELDVWWATSCVQKVRG